MGVPLPLVVIGVGRCQLNSRSKGHFDVSGSRFLEKQISKFHKC